MQNGFVAAIVGALISTGVMCAPVADAKESWPMPDVVGMDLQGAQDMVQSVTSGAVFYSGSTDLTGEGRMQIDDRNWQVCTSSPAAGTPITTTTDIDFGVVRIDTETCP